MKNFEQLGSFYVGRRYDLEQQSVLDEAILYDAKDLTTHAVCVGMTGSGKTGLAISILEEAAIDGIPVIAIDPKGDIGNVLLTFPELRGEDFLPWIDEGEALRKGRTPEEHARWTADLWRKGLADWGQGPDRIRRFAEAVDRRIYTPGSRAGHPVAVLRSLVAPADPTDDEALQERIAGAVSGLLSLLGIEADPLRSREHILLANILAHAWRANQDVDLPGLIQLIQKPPFERVGVFDVESFYGQDDRFELAMMLNNLLASPGFAIWTEGPPLDVASLLYTPDGKPRISVLTLGHLSDSERMFFVTTLLNEVVTWTRSQSGSRSLRAILYMDEVFGYLPPTANPPSKRPLLTLLKQARAFGLGVVLATQNPVDLDYKALSNIGTWFLGRLQTERDKLRVLDGLEGAAAGAGGFDRGVMDRLLSSLDSRVFLMNNVHDDEPTLLHTRWVLSYLGGPLTREQISRLTPSESAETTAATTSPTAVPGRVASTSKATAAAGALSELPGSPAAMVPPSLPPEVPQHFAPVRTVGDVDERLIFRPHLAAHVTLHHANTRANVDEWTSLTLAAPLGAKRAANVWSEAEELATAVEDWTAEPEDEGEFADLPSSARDPKRYRTWERALKSEVYRSRALTLFHCPSLKLYSLPGEEEGAFQARLRDRIREERDLKLEKLRARYAPKLERLQDRIRTAELRIEQEHSQAKEKKMAAAVSVGTTLLGALFGRKLASTGNVRRASTSMRAAGRIAREKDDMERAQAKYADLQQKLESLEEEFETKLDDLRDKIQLDNFEVKETSVAPRKADIAISDLTLLWIPWRVDADGIATPAV